MKRILLLLAGLAILAGLTACSPKNRPKGAGVGSVVAGTAPKKAYMTAYGYYADDTLGYFIVTDVANEGAVATAWGSWKGEIDPNAGPKIKYQATRDGIDITGTTYDFAAGRVFLITTTPGSFGVKQIKLPFRGDPYQTEMEKLGKSKEVQEFLAPPAPVGPPGEAPAVDESGGEEE